MDYRRVGVSQNVPLLNRVLGTAAVASVIAALLMSQQLSRAAEPPASSGNFAAVTEHANCELRLSPFDPVAFVAHTALGHVAVVEAQSSPIFVKP